MSTDLSLWRIDETLAQLLSLREEMTADGENIAEVEKQIAEYMQALPAKVSGVCAMFRMWKSQQAAIKAEEDRLHELRKRVEANEARLKEYCAYVLEQQPEPKKGCKKLIGADGSQLMLKGNGGLEPLQIDESVLPDDYREVTVRMPLEMWRDISKTFAAESWAKIVDQGPDNTAIRAAIQQHGGIPGARLLERGQHLEIR